MMLVPAGPAVDAVIEGLLPHLEKDDLLIDGGNSHFTDTDRRDADLAEKGFGFMGVGVSGGEEGARHGASIMPGGRRDFYDRVEKTLQAVSAKVNGDPCVAYMGTGSAGHFVKMVHNGIEYGLMQLIAETYDLLRRGFNMSNAEAADIFEQWNNAELNSFLIEITTTVLRKIDPETGRPLTELILDTAGQKGTGKWTSEVAMDYGVPIPTIDSAVSMRQISARKAERVKAAKLLNVVMSLPITSEFRGQALGMVKDGLYVAFIVTYAQGLSLLKTASTEKGYGLDLTEIAKIWRGGCIIRAALLEEIRTAYFGDPGLENLLLADNFRDTIRSKYMGLKTLVHFALSCNVPCMSLAATANYLTSYASERLPANLIQAQRDFFGAHTYQRLDKEGTFHTPDWDK
jgi:6-phosphogluconate dehydrogenase